MLFQTFSIIPYLLSSSFHLLISMCGIAGILHQTAITSASIEATKEALRSRGPDGSGSNLFSFSEKKGWHHATEGHAALIQTRLSIRDTSIAGTQPMKNEDGSVWIVYNGEVYGWEQEARFLRDRGHRFMSHSDTEFILHGYEEWGDAVVERLRGMFAIAIFDLRKHRLLLARDRLGEKPLFYTTQNGLFAFASTARALATLTSQTRPRFDSRAIDAFLAHRYIPAPLSIIEGFQKLPAAHSLVVSLEKAEPYPCAPHQYWAPESAQHQEISQKSASALFEEAIRLRLVSDRPLGLFLSGGIDSQAIAAKMAHSDNMPELTAFTATFPENKVFDESASATSIAERLRLKHCSLPIKMDSSDAVQIIHDLDEPFADPSAIPTWYLCQAAAKEIVVALAGDGGDELFAGYKRYHAHERTARLLSRHGHQPQYWSSSRLCLKTSLGGRLRRSLLECQLGWQESYALRFAALDPLSRAFLQPDMAVQPSYWRQPDSSLAPREWMLECDRLNYLPEYILRKSDLCGMAHGLELRAPLLDHLFFQAICQMPAAKRFSKPPKQFLIDQIGPQALLGPKRGFNPPLSEWLRQKNLAAICHTLPRELEELTQGQLPAKRLAILMQQARQDPRLDEITWMLVVLIFSLRGLPNC
ncbi:MAG: asparagine synthase (glutamine-hydrolyzing) [Chthoniobacterales bacterium]|nr:asparagine synthase (glutamine-hydrolyzing) [Chthoniobacterales bacterium]